ncbi:Rv3235 family protein [Cellulomonas sp. NS3]|uniref:Rv3235 family protein n=1 Tax=Cellulomonas sp. NS3 TaxID=2973977 RepID=UPI0021612953|nr:Rv3235 family protein [Cellulomonas sp. NS3]
MTTLELTRDRGHVPAGVAAPGRCSDTPDSPGTAEAPASSLGRPVVPRHDGGATGTGTPSACVGRTGDPELPAAPSTTPRARLVPTLPPAARPAPATGPGHTRPPTLEQRLLARRRATLAAERAARAAEPPRETAPMPDPTPVCCALALAATEAMRGTRSVAQLARWVSPAVFEQLAARAALTVRVLGRGAATRRPEVLRVRVCRLGEHVAEAAVVVDDGTRVRAVALRLEMWRGAWRAVAFEIG